MKFIESFLKPHPSIESETERVKSSFLSAITLMIWLIFIGMSIMHFFSPPLRVPLMPITGVLTIPIAYIINRIGRYRASAYLLMILFSLIHIVDLLISSSPAVSRDIYPLSVSIVLSAMLLELSDTITITLINLGLILLLPLIPAKNTIHYHSILHPFIFTLLISALVILFAEFSKKLNILHLHNLEQNYERFQILFDNMPVALWEYDGIKLINYLSELKERGISDLIDYMEKNPKEVEKCYELLKVTDANKRAIELYGFKSKQEFINNINKLFKKYNLEEFKKVMVPFFEGRNIDEREHIHYTAEGKEITVLRRIFIPRKYKENWKHIIIAVVDITNFRKLQHKLEERAKSLELILKVAKDINQELNLEKFFLNTVKTISKTLAFYNCSIWIVENNSLVLKAFSFSQTNEKKEGNAKSVIEKYPIEGIIGWAVRDNEIKYVKDVSKDPHYIAHYREIKTKSECAIPLRDKGRVIGALDIQSDKVNTFSESDIELFSSVADQISVAIRNATLYEALLKRAKRLEAINSVARVVNSTLDTDAIIEKAYLIIKKTFDFDAFYLALYDKETQIIDYKVVEDMGERLNWNRVKLSEAGGSAAYVIRERRSINLRDVSEFIKEQINKKAPLHGKIPKKLLAVPLQTESNTIGVISVQSYGERDFDSEDEIFLSTVAEQIAIALKNANLYNSLQKELAQRKMLEHKLLQSQKLEAIGKLAGGVAHEFNNLLTAILGNVDLLLISSEGQRFHMELTEIRNAAERAANLTAQLLTFGKKQLVEVEDIEINNQILELKETFLNILGENIELKLKLTDKKTTVKSNYKQLSRVFINIVTNAKESMPNGGFLTIETDVITVEDFVTEANTLLNPGEYVIIKITDTGVGIDSNTLSRIFDPFFTTKKFGAGSGLGLSIAYGIIRQFEGDITASSTPGKGTTISIYLPIANTTKI